jgi:hypothetical protein
MKRSEMLDLMMDVILSNQGKRVTDSMVLDDMLEAIEKAGMLPPTTKVIGEPIQRYDELGNKTHIERSHFKRNKWEPEE